jgi:hypothetical protein
MTSPLARGARRRVWTKALSLVALLLFTGSPAASQTVKETRVSFQSGSTHQNGYEHAGLDIIYSARSCSASIHIGYGVEPGSIDVTSGYWYEGHRYAIRSGWPGPRTQPFSVRMIARHGAATFMEWDKRDPITTSDLSCGTAPQFFYVQGGWEALLGDRAGDPAAREHALASISLDTPFHADRTLRNTEIEALIRREIEAAEAARIAEERAAETARMAEASRQVEDARGANAPHAEASAAGGQSDQTLQGAAEREEAQRRREADAEERYAREVERQRAEAERRREEERQAAVSELGRTLEQGLLAGVAITGYAALPAVAREGVSREYGLRFGTVGEKGGFLFGFGTNDMSMFTGGEPTSNQFSFTAGGEVGLAFPDYGLSKAFMPFVGAYYKSVEFYEDPVYDQEEESWETWGFNLGFMGVLGDFLVYQVGMTGDLGVPDINYMRGGDGGFFLSLGFQMNR